MLVHTGASKKSSLQELCNCSKEPRKEKMRHTESILLVKGSFVPSSFVNEFLMANKENLWLK